MLADPAADERPHRVRALAPFTRADYVVFALQFVLALVAYGSPLVAGRLFVPGDDLNQNLPLRILSGSYIAAGHIPAWDPLIWSGTPLLAGWNAGSFFPGTLLFSFLPVSVAWTINVVATPLICSLGTYLLLRRFKVGVLGAFFGATIFSYTGFMSGQMVHLGLAQGTAFMPWLVLGLDVFLRSSANDEQRGVIGFEGVGTKRPSRLAAMVRQLGSIHTELWMVVIAISLACTVLAGDPRAITSTAVVAIVYIVALIIRDYRPLMRAWLPLALALVLGVLLSAIQSVPGIAFLDASQRGTATLAFFGSGSLPPREVFLNALLPFDLGTSGSFGLPAYYGNYNLPEVTIGAGLIALVALCSYVPSLLNSLRATLRPRRPRITADPRRQLGVWLTLGIIGVVLSIGTDSPVGRVLHHLPLYGTERLQNRNAVIFDFALAIFAAFFIDDLIGLARRRENQERVARRSSRIDTTAARLAGMIPVVMTLAALIIELVSPLTIQRWLQVPFPSPTLATRLLGYLIATAVLTLAIGAFWWWHGRLAPKYLRNILIILLVCDVGMYVANTSYATAPSSVFTGPTALSTQIEHDLGGEGRFAIFDPDYYLTYTQPVLLEQLGFPDINTVLGDPSVQGYGSIVNGVYQRVTGTHLIDTFDASIIPAESVNTLDLRVLLVPSGYLDRTIAAHAPIPVPNGQALAANGVNNSVSGPWTIAAGASEQWQLPSPTSLERSTVVFKTPLTAEQKSIDVSLYNRRKKILSETVATSGKQRIIQFTQTPTATTIVLSNPTSAPITVDAVTVVSRHPHQRYVLDGLLEGELNNSHWVYEGTIGSLSVFRNLRIHGFAWLQSPTSHTPNTALSIPGSVVVDRGAVTDSTVMTVTTDRTALLVRSEAYASGWTATITPVAGGPSVTEKVHRFGLIQQITVPKGRFRVTWHYDPSSITEGLILTFVGAVITLCMLIAIVLGRWRRRNNSASRGRGLEQRRGRVPLEVC